MKKIVVLFLLFLSSTSYPLSLTKKDLATIAALQIAGLGLGFGGAMLGIKQYIPSLPPLHQTPEEDLASVALMHADFRRWFTPFAIQTIAIPAILTVVPMAASFALANRLAALYIARKYKVSYQEALDYIKNFPDSDDRIKKEMEDYFNTSTSTK